MPCTGTTRMNKNEIILAKVTNDLVAIRCFLVFFLLNFSVMFKLLIPSLLDILPSFQFLNITLWVYSSQLQNSSLSFLCIILCLLLKCWCF